MKSDFFFKKTKQKFAGLKKSLTFATAFSEMFLTKDNCGNSSVGRAQPCQGWGRGSESRFPLNILNTPLRRFFPSLAQVAELVDAHVSGACVSRRAGSSPVLGTLFRMHLHVGEVAELVDALL